METDGVLALLLLVKTFLAKFELPLLFAALSKRALSSEIKIFGLSPRGGFVVISELRPRRIY